MGTPARAFNDPTPTSQAVIHFVLDTNVLVSSALPGSRLRPLIDAWQRGRCRLLISPEIFDEYLRVLTYPKFQLSSDDIRRILERDVMPYSEMVRVTSHVDVVKADPADNKFLACAIDGKADAIVSGDHHLLNLKTYQKIPIVTAREFLNRLFK